MAYSDPHDPTHPAPRWRGALQRAAFVLVGASLLFAYEAFAH